MLMKMKMENTCMWFSKEFQLIGFLEINGLFSLSYKNCNHTSVFNIHLAKVHDLNESSLLYKHVLKMPMGHIAYTRNIS